MKLPDTPRIKAADAFADAAHAGVFRKGTGTVPYIHHPRRVASRIAAITNDEDMIVAALLHDVLEDTDVSEQVLTDLFGLRVTRLVKELTATSSPLNRKERKLLEAYRLGLVSADAQTIKYADMLDNLKDIFELSEDFAKVYIVEKTTIFSEMTRGDETLRAELATRLIYLNEKIGGLDSYQKVDPAPSV